jgi:hypothetical protein
MLNPKNLANGQELIVKYHNGYIPFCYNGASAAQVKQVLKQIQPDLKAKCGDYTWQLVGDTYTGYKIIAKYRGGQFTESLGKSPSKALKNFYMARQVLVEKYNVC